MPEDALQLFRDRLSTVTPEWQQRVVQYEANYRRIIAREQAGPFNSKIATKYIQSQILVHTAFMVSGLIGTHPWVRAKAAAPFGDVEPSATEEFSRRLETLGFFRGLYLWLRAGTVYGVGIKKMSWSPSGIHMPFVNPANIAWDPAAHNLRYDAEYVIERHNRLTASMLVARAKDGMYRMDAVRKVLQSTGSSERTPEQDIEKIRTSREAPIPVKGDRRILVHEMVMRDRLITVHEPSNVVLRDTPNPYLRIFYYDLTPYPELAQVQGYSMPELLENIDHEKNTCRQQRTDIRSLEANPMIFLKRGSGLNPNSMRSKPGKIFPIREQGDIELAQFHDTGAPLLQEEGVLEMEGDRLTGIQAHTRGERGAEMKATVANLLHTNVNVRFSAAIKMALDYPFRPFLADFVELSGLDEAAQAIPQERWNLLREIIKRRAVTLRFQPEAHVGNPFAKIQILAQVLQIAQGALLPQGQALLIKEMLKLAEVPNYEEVSKYVAPLPAPALGQGGARNDQGMGVAMTGEMARGRAAGQPPMAMRVVS